MDRTTLLEALDIAERHIAQGERHIRRQQEILARLTRTTRGGTSQTATIAKDVLHSMQRAQRAHLKHRDQLKAELARLNAVEESPAAGSLDWPAVGAFSSSTDGSDSMDHP